MKQINLTEEQLHYLFTMIENRRKYCIRMQSVMKGNKKDMRNKTAADLFSEAQLIVPIKMEMKKNMLKFINSGDD